MPFFAEAVPRAGQGACAVSSNEAERQLNHLAAVSPEERLCKVYLDRIAYFRAKPPNADWGGVFVFTTK